MQLARAHGLPVREYLQRVTGRDLAAQEALDRVAGPLGEDRQDWRFAWLAWWIIRSQGGAKDATAEDFYHIFLSDTQQKREHEQDVVEIIDEDPEVSDRKAKEIQAWFEARYPKPSEEKASD